MTNDNARRAALQQLIANDAVGQLRRHDGLMATLDSEDGVLKLDWVEGIARLLAHPTQLEEAEMVSLRADDTICQVIGVLDGTKLQGFHVGF